MPVIQLVPADQLFFRERIAFTSFFSGEQASPDSRDDFRLATGHPTADTGGWKIIPCEGLTVRAFYTQCLRVLLFHGDPPLLAVDAVDASASVDLCVAERS